MLQTQLRQVRITGPDGGSRPLVQDERVVSPNRLVPPPTSPPDLRMPLGAAGLLLGALLLATRLWWPTGHALLGTLFLLLAGLVGVVLLGLWTLTTHHSAWANANLLLPYLQLDRTRELRVLDVAAGSAAWSLPIAENLPKANVTVLDLPPVCDVAREFVDRHSLQSRYDYMEGDLKKLNFGAEKFDVIMFSECIGYAHDPGALVARYLPWLEPGGTVVISHFRFGHWAKHWARVFQHARPFAETSVSNPVRVAGSS